jgi:hypothetical protein
MENLEMRELVRQATENSKAVREKAKSTYIADTLEYQERFREQSSVQQENLSIIRDQYRKVTEIYKRKATDMSERLELQTSKANKIEQRRKLELEGYGADLENMKRKIEFYQKYISKLKSLVEQDQGVADLFTKLKTDD